MKQKINIIFGILIVIFSMSVVPKTLQNDTFFTIPIGNYILEHGGLDGMDHWSYHENLRFTHSGWIFDLMILFSYQKGGFFGCYVFTMIVTGGIGLLFFVNLLSHKNSSVLSFMMTIIVMGASAGFFTARAQILSLWLLLLEVLSIHKFLEKGQKRYAVCLIFIALVLANTHDTVWPVYFVVYLPYIAEFALYQFGKLLDYKFEEKLVVQRKSHMIKLILIGIIAIFTGFLTPVLGTPFTNIINVMKGISTEEISELQSVNLLTEKRLLFISITTIGILAFTKTKIKIVDGLLIGGFLLSGLLASRNISFAYLIAGLYFTNIVTDFFQQNDRNQYFEKIQIKMQKPISTIIISITILLLATCKFVTQLGMPYIDEKAQPVKATAWIKENIDLATMRIYNHFNFGSYLELNEIPVFIDSRSGIYCSEFNDTTVFQDFCAIKNGKQNYREIFEKYQITHALLYNQETINLYICYDEDYELIYKDEDFSLYQKKGKF